jgi:hypothetical protein
MRGAGIRFERSDNHGGVVGLRQLGGQLHVEVAQEVGPNGLDLNVRELLSAASVTSTAESKPSVALGVAAQQTSRRDTGAGRRRAEAARIKEKRV